MNNEIDNKDRRKHSEMLINELLTERHRVWSLFCRVAEQKPFTQNQQIQKTINEFSQLLIDYISLGDFGIYQRLLDGKERRSAILQQAEDMYEQFMKTTDAAVTFNDKYVSSENTTIRSESLEHDLAILGESLAKRIDIEDKLCQIITH